MSFAILGSALAQTSAAHAQNAAIGDAVVYQAEFFMRFKPQTAYDVVQNVPGFALEEMTEARGLIASSGNVLIDGKRPTTKSGGLQEVLSRISAANVARVEVSRGTAQGSDLAGQIQVLNIVRSAAVNSGTWTVQAERASEPELNGLLQGTISRRVSDWNLTGRANARWRKRDYVYYNRATFARDGILTQFQLETSPRTVAEAYVYGEAKRPIWWGALTITGRFGNDSDYRVRDRENRLSTSPLASGVTRQLIIDDVERLVAESSLEWVRERPSGWKLKLGALGSWVDSGQDQTSQDGPFGQPLANKSLFASDQTAVEVVTRGSASRSGSLSREFGVEVAYNSLDSVVTANQFRLALPVANAARLEETLVEESRVEMFAKLGWTIATRLRLETGLAVELSQIDVSGDRKNRQNLSYVKPTIAVSYSFSEGVLGRFSAQRRVSQLNFTDFAASADFSDERQLSGNAKLRPEQIWRTAMGLDLRSKRRAALSVEAYYEAINDVLEQGILTDGSVGLVNQGKGERWGLTARGSLPLSPAIEGGVLELNFNWRDTEFRDPLTLETRTLAYFTPLTGNLGFRQDLTNSKIAWGLRAVFREQDKWYFVNEYSRRHRGAAYSAYIETTRYLGLKMRFDIENIGDRRNGDTRDIFQPDRRAILQRTQISNRAEGTIVKLTFSDQF